MRDRLHNSLCANAVALAVGLAGFAHAAADIPDSLEDICPSDADPCVIDHAWNVANVPFSLDFGTRTVRIQDAGQLDVGKNTEYLACGRFETAGGSAPAFVLHGSEQFDMIPGGEMNVTAYRSCNDSPSTRCLNDAGCPSGVCQLGDGNIVFEGAVSGNSSFGAELSLHAAGAVEFGGKIAMNGIHPQDDDLTYGGWLYIDSESGPVTFTGKHSAKGSGAAGDLEIISGGDVILNGGIKLDGGEGGFVTIYAAGAVSIDGRIGAGGKAAFDGYGGQLEIEAEGDITFGANNARIDMRGGKTFGYGGSVNAYSPSRIVVAGGARINLRGGGDGTSVGGFVFLLAGTELILDGSVSVASPGEGGELNFEADEISVGDRARIDANGGQFSGGFIDFAAGSALEIAGRVSSRGFEQAGAIHLAGGAVTVTGDLVIAGGSTSTGLDITACSLTLGAGSSVEVDVPGGAGLHTVTSDQFTIAAGASVSAPADGVHSFQYFSEGPAPIILGSVQPAPTLTPVAGYPCF